MTSKDYLQRAYKIDKRLKLKKIRLQLLQNLATEKSPNLSGLPHGTGVQSQMEELAVKIVEMKESIQEDEKLLSEVRKEIRKAIYGIPNENFVTILDMRYLQYMSWDDIIAQTGYCQSHVFRLHGEALKMINIPNESK